MSIKGEDFDVVSGAFGIFENTRSLPQLPQKRLSPLHRQVASVLSKKSLILIVINTNDLLIQTKEHKTPSRMFQNSTSPIGCC